MMRPQSINEHGCNHRRTSFDWIERRTVSLMVVLVVISILSATLSMVNAFSITIVVSHSHAALTLNRQSTRRNTKAVLVRKLTQKHALQLYFADTPLHSGADDDFSSSEIQKMEKLILSLSNESNDQSRRERLTAIFNEELEKPNGAPQKFSALFDKVLITVGDRVRAEAIEKATASSPMELNQQQTQDEKRQPQEMVPNFNPVSKQPEKSPEELQIWALIDMMVQSKTIVKRANGRLGSEGKFG